MRHTETLRGWPAFRMARDARERACLKGGGGDGTVVLGAGPSQDWSRQRSVLEGAIAGFVAG